MAGARTRSAELAELIDEGRVHEVQVDLATPDGPAELVAAALGRTARSTCSSTTSAR